MLALAIEEHDVGHAAQGFLIQHFARSGVQGDEHAGIAGAEQALGGAVKIEAVRTGMGHGEAAGDLVGLTRVDHDDLGRLGDIHIEKFRPGIEHGPARAAAHGDLAASRVMGKIDHRQGMRAGHRRVADICRQHDLPARVVGEAIGSSAHVDDANRRLRSGGKHADRVGRPVRREDELALIAYQGAGDAGQAGDRKEISPACGIEHIDGIVGRVRHVDMAARGVNGGMIEAAFRLVLGQYDVAGEMQGHDVTSGGRTGGRPRPARCPRTQGRGP